MVRFVYRIKNWEYWPVWILYTPVLATTDKNNLKHYFLITNIHGGPIHKEILPFIGKPAEITGIVEKMEDWYVFKIDTENIKELKKKSAIY
ncbi:hypothetical protein N8201_00490 [Polaribacter sp.]|nr:hypothetical protein [Polaribacter sp.]